MNISERILTVLKDKNWLYMREIISKIPKTISSKSIRSTVFYLKETERVKARAKLNEYGKAIANTFQYAITDKGKGYLIEKNS